MVHERLPVVELWQESPMAGVITAAESVATFACDVLQRDTFLRVLYGPLVPDHPWVRTQADSVNDTRAKTRSGQGDPRGKPGPKWKSATKGWRPTAVRETRRHRRPATDQRQPMAPASRSHPQPARDYIPQATPLLARALGQRQPAILLGYYLVNR